MPERLTGVPTAVCADSQVSAPELVALAQHGPPYKDGAPVWRGRWDDRLLCELYNQGGSPFRCASSPVTGSLSGQPQLLVRQELLAKTHRNPALERRRLTAEILVSALAGCIAVITPGLAACDVLVRTNSFLIKQLEASTAKAQVCHICCSRREAADALVCCK